ncbi:hypothetical protein JYU05_00050 [bacterium AH-315-P13]|nr:hypothetical protein [bacterium AH-315-P13]
MIKFFRKIRQNMIRENKVVKYLLYAIGEITLVILGILIALQINSENQIKKDRLLEQQYYCRLLEDVEQDKEQIILLISDAQERLENSNKMARILQRPNPDLTEVNVQFAKIQRGSLKNFSANNAAYEDLKSGANLNLITDITLKGLLNNYFKNVLTYAITVKGNFEVDTKEIEKLRKNVIEFGVVYGYIHSVKNSFDKDVLDKIMKEKPNSLSKTVIDYYYNLSISRIINNARRVQLYQLIDKEIDTLTAALKKKCN